MLVNFISCYGICKFLIMLPVSLCFQWNQQKIIENTSIQIKRDISADRVTMRHSWPIIQYIPRNMHTVFALLCFVVVIHWLIFPYPSGLRHWHCGNLTIVPVPAKQPWWIWINTSCEFIMNDCITTTKQSTTKPCAYFLGYGVVNELLRVSRLLSAKVKLNAALCIFESTRNLYYHKTKAIGI